MVNFIQKWFPMINTERKFHNKVSLSTLKLLQRDIENCYTIEDYYQLKAVLQLCWEDFSKTDLFVFMRNMVYRKKLIQYIEKNLPDYKYSAHEFHTLIRSTESYMVLDAIKLHIEKNKQYYQTNCFGTRKYDISIFENMIATRKEFIISHFYTA
jgi:hypothetical protein